MYGVNLKNLKDVELPENGDQNDDLKDLIRDLIVKIGENPKRQGLLRTPERVARMFAELTEGYRVVPEKLINDAVFEMDYDEMVVVKDIDFASLCEHHLLPFIGRAHVAYIPNGKVIGLSKIPRIVEMYARRLQIQECMTIQIADFLVDHLNPAGVAVVVEGQHLCSMIRGVKKPNSTMVTSAMRGDFKQDQRTRQEFMSLIGKS